VVTWGEIITAGPTNRIWMPAGTYTATVSAASGPYSIWAVAVASYGAVSDPAVTNARLGTVASVKTKKVTQR
jgi:archaellum component FlaF (FlaF/FlaG flagellin family)